MISRDLLRHHPETVRTALRDRAGDESVVDAWSSVDERRRAVQVEVEAKKRERNEASKAIGQLKREGLPAEAEIAAVGRLKQEIEALGAEFARLGEAQRDLELTIPNRPDASVPIGLDEAANEVVRVVGTPPSFDFEPRAHWDLGPELGILDFERGAKLSGSRFTAYLGLGARLERALINFMLDVHTEEHGYIEVLPPFLVNANALLGTGNLPKFEDDLFAIQGHDLYLIPTAEVPLTNLHATEILDPAELPKRYAAFTPCFRAEAGSHGRDVRGLIRQHQFNKVELVHVTTAETSWDAHEELTANAERILQRLELPYRTVCLSTGDTSFASAKTYDLEVWLPGQSTYREISSCSNCLDFQARRAGIRYRGPDGKPVYAHTLNGSALAVGRTLVAILENFQRADGTVMIPEVLRSYVGADRITTGS